ncbi:ABC-2 family transporter protein [Micrococcales bacterium 31B]|nr:ABC-2 family transporter protein [Micrococcales bacterium 31B]
MAEFPDARPLPGSPAPDAPAQAPRRPDPTLRDYARIVGVIAVARIKGQTSYRASFYADLASQLILIAVEFIELFAILGSVPVFANFTLGQSVALFGLSAFIFSLADLLFGEIENFSEYIRSGKVDVLMLRPLPVLLQIMANDIQIRRSTRMTLGLVTCVAGFVMADVPLTLAGCGFLVLAVVAGVTFYGGTFIVSGAIQFWLIDSKQLGNAFVYGSNYVSQYPAGAMYLPLRVFFTYVIPALLTIYLPAAYALDASPDAAHPPWLIWLVLPGALAFFAVAMLVWRAGTRHYEGAGG